MATQSGVATSAGLIQSLGPALLVRLRKFLWLSSGLFSAASFAMAMVGVLAYGSTEGLGLSFLAGTASACLFGLASLLRFGPETA
jgi:hypothetical protein